MSEQSENSTNKGLAEEQRERCVKEELPGMSNDAGEMVGHGVMNV